VTAGKPGGVGAERLAKLFSIPFNDAVRTLAVTTQLNRRTADSSLSRNFGTNDRMVRYRQLDSTFFTDTMYVTAKAKSTHGNTCAQLQFQYLSRHIQLTQTSLFYGTLLRRNS
jgi:hypothetical protein